MELDFFILKSGLFILSFSNENKPVSPQKFSLVDISSQNNSRETKFEIKMFKHVRNVSNSQTLKRARRSEYF